MVSQVPAVLPAFGNMFFRNKGRWQLSFKVTFKSVQPQGLFCPLKEGRLVNSNPRTINKEGTPKETFFIVCWIFKMALKFVFISYHIYYQV